MPVPSSFRALCPTIQGLSSLPRKTRRLREETQPRLAVSVSERACFVLFPEELGLCRLSVHKVQEDRRRHIQAQ